MKQLTTTSLFALALCVLACVAIDWATKPGAATASNGWGERAAEAGAVTSTFVDGGLAMSLSGGKVGQGAVEGTRSAASREVNAVAVHSSMRGGGIAGGGFRFRGFAWGDSQQKIRSGETSEVVSEDGATLVVADRIDGLSCTLTYRFDGGVLVGARYEISKRYTDKFYHISDFGSLKTLLGQKYGAPIEDRVEWKNDYLKDNPSRWGEALGLGQLVLSARWSADQTGVGLHFERYADDLNLIIDYQSTEFAPSPRGASSEEVLRGL